MLKTMLVYGNGQAEAVADVLGKTPQVSELMQTAHLSSFDYVAASGDARGCAVFCEQYDPPAFPCRDRLGERCFKLKFPALDLNVLWPFYCVNPYNAARAPDLPFGPFPYGDRIILDAVDRGMPPDDILEYYVGGWSRYRIDLDRFQSVEAARLAERDAQCTVKMSAYILENFARRRLFLTVDRPSTTLLEELIDGILAACGRVDSLLLDADVTAHFPPTEPLGQMTIPIHPKVAEHFALEWYDPNEVFRGRDGTEYSYTEYFSAMIAHAYAVKEKRL